MNKYELAVAVNGKLEESDKNATVDKVKALIERFGGSITSVDDWGKKRYAYEVSKTKEGWYLFIKFQAESEAPAEIEQRIRIMDNIHRYLIVSDEKELVVKHDERRSENEAETAEVSENAEPVEASKQEEAAPAAEEQASSSEEA
ncbi:MAG: 30S ribosomal protein S6 [Lachnospiraceae bacterium]|nr:30S ribosomal protein S6 [Lachnospiraceae bacterium]